MKRILFSGLVLMLCLTMALPVNAETLNFYQVINTWDEGFKIFRANHPEVKYEWSEDYYANTSELAGKLLTRELRSDILGIMTNSIDAQQIMSKGYFLDLSGSTAIRAVLDQMVPAIAASAMNDGKIYALPYCVWFDYWQASQPGWEAAGLDRSAVPHSFPKFLDFLDAWCDRIEIEPEYNIRIWSGWDATVYNRSSYTFMLTEMLMNSVMIQSEYAGQEIEFSAQELAPLLDRISALGQRIYDAEPAIGVSDTSFGYSLFEPITRPVWPQDSSSIVSLRLNDDQPQLMPTRVTMMAVYSATASSELCVEMLESMSATLQPEQKAYLYLHGEAVEDPDYETKLATARQYVTATEAKLKAPNLAIDLQDELEQDLVNYRRMLEKAEQESSRYIVTPAQVHDYQQHTDALYVATPGAFLPGTGGYTKVLELEHRFASGQMTTQDFLKQMNDLARMVRLEG